MIKRVLFFLIVICSVYTNAVAIVLPLNTTPQQQTQWCWASCSQAIIRWFGDDVNQCILADELRIASGWENDQCCSYGFRTLDYFDSGMPPCNQPNYLAGGFWSVQDILDDHNIDSIWIGNIISQNAVQTEVNAGRPFVFAWLWDSGGGHALVCRGQEGSNFYYFNPWPITNFFQVGTYNWVVDGSNHFWVQTLRTDSTPSPPIPDIKVNGHGGTYYTNSSANLDLAFTLTDGLYAGTAADWWVLVYVSGQYFFLDQYGNWTTTSTTWSQSNLYDRYYSIFNGSLPQGTYTVYFGVDLTKDGVINDPLYYDSVTIVVQ